MRLRFSIRWLMVLVAAMALVCYVLFVRPAVLAQRLVNAVHSRDYETAKSLVLNTDAWPLNNQSVDGELSVDSAYAEVLPRDWSDIWALRQRLILRVLRRDNSNGRQIRWAEDCDMLARVHGVQIVVAHADYVRFKP